MILSDKTDQKENNRMKKPPGFLDDLAAKYGVFISDLRLKPQLRQTALQDLKSIAVPLDRQQEWQEAMDYLETKE